VATEARKLRVGVFVLATLLIAITTAIWLGASHFLTDEETAVTYFSESVQGLDPGAAVKLRGVPVGRVDRIGMAPDGDLIEVVMSLRSDFAARVLKDPNLRAQLQLSGITGLRYVEIDHHTGDALQRSPQLTFQPAYPLVPSTPSQFKAIQEALQDIYGRVMSVDLPGISADTRATLQAAERLLSDERLQQVLTNMTEVTAAASRATANVAEMTENVRLEPVVRDLRRATEEAQRLLVELRTGETGNELRSALREVDGLARSGEALVLDLNAVIERINRAAENLAQLTDALRQQPSRLLFSEPPPPRPRPEPERE
jgi:phospholipid/cholesterol/gamma-HCH transport system substrate-binding protein